MTVAQGWIWRLAKERSGGIIFTPDDAGGHVARETWAIYSVRDHLAPYPFVADVLLYDRVRVPVPDPGDLRYWTDHCWDPARQQRFVDALGERAKPIRWSGPVRERWNSAYRVASESAQETGPDAFAMTRLELINSLPRSVTGVETVAAYRDWSHLQAEGQVTRLESPDSSFGIVSAAIAWDFAVPPQLGSAPADHDEELRVLEAAVRMSDGTGYRRNGAAYWRWVRDFAAGTVTGQEAIQDAVEELEELVLEQESFVRQTWADRVVRTGFLIGAVSLGMVAGPLTPVSLAAAALGVGQFTWGELRQSKPPQHDAARVAAMFCQIDRQIRAQLFAPRGTPRGEGPRRR